jgi:hypothetical protein
MKRVGNLFDKICERDNIILAEKIASRGKGTQRDVIKHKLNYEENITELENMLRNKTYTTSEYKNFSIKEKGKVRDISSLPFFPDRVIQHTLMNILEPIFVSTYTSNTYSCIKGRGVHKASFRLRKHLKEDDYKYCLKIDIKKFFPSVDNEVLKELLRRKFKDEDLIWLLEDIINSAKGLPIGSYISQYLSNFYLTYFDHWVKEDLQVGAYLRYCDDMIFLSNSKEELWRWFYQIQAYLSKNLKLEIKSNYQVFPIEARGIDWCGYKHFKDYTLIRKSIKKNYKRNKNKKNHYGWLKHCNSINLRNKYENN